jgi:hypothetical protein
MAAIDMGALQDGPHAHLIREMAELCATDPAIQAAWVGGSLAAGTGDAFSDVDFRIAVEQGQVETWTNPDWQRYLPLPPVGSVLLRFGEGALLHHMVLADGAIVDFYVQEVGAVNPEPEVVVLFARSATFREMLHDSTRPPAALVRAIEGAQLRQFLVDYWIITHKQMKALARRYDDTAFAGLYMERMALLRAWYMQMVDKDIDARMSIHMLGALHRGLDGKLSAAQREMLGMPSRTPAETVLVIEAIRREMAAVGRELAARYGAAYPHELEAVAQRTWAENKAFLILR